MKITINTQILKRHNLSLGEFLLLLIGYYDIDLQATHSSILEKVLAEPNVMKEMGIVLSNNSKDLVAQILMESDDRAIQSSLDFEDLALKLMKCYPDGNKPGTTHPWRSTMNIIAQKLRVLVVVHNFTFTEKEAIDAVKAYLASFEKLDKDTMTLRSFLLKTKDNDVESLFMSYIENTRDICTGQQ